MPPPDLIADSEDSEVLENADDPDEELDAADEDATERSGEEGTEDEGQEGESSGDSEENEDEPESDLEEQQSESDADEEGELDEASEEVAGEELAELTADASGTRQEDEDAAGTSGESGSQTETGENPEVDSLGIDSEAVDISDAVAESDTELNILDTIETNLDASESTEGNVSTLSVETVIDQDSIETLSTASPSGGLLAAQSQPELQSLSLASDDAAGLATLSVSQTQTVATLEIEETQIPVQETQEEPPPPQAEPVIPPDNPPVAEDDDFGDL